MKRLNSERDCLRYNIKLITNSQMKFELDRCCDYSRYIWNKLLELELQYQKENFGKRSPAGYLLKKCRELRKQNLWELKLPEYIMCQVERRFRSSLSEIINFNIAVKSSKDTSKEYKSLKFKTKKYDVVSFEVPNTKYVKGSFKPQGKNYLFAIYLSAKSKVKRKYRWMKIPELPKGLIDGSARILSSCIFKRYGEYYISFCMEAIELNKLPEGRFPLVGIDPGVEHTMVLSTGRKYNYPIKLKELDKRKRFYQSRLAKRYNSKSKTQSKNFYKTRAKLIKTEKRIADLKQDWLHKITTSIAKKFKEVHWEDTSASKLMKNHRIAKAISDSNWYTIRLLLSYKVMSRNGTFVLIDIAKASTQTCSNCGYRLTKEEKLTLKDRVFVCPECGYIEDRDINAAKNIAKFN